jgi:Flp pilus assembly protein TadD
MSWSFRSAASRCTPASARTRRASATAASASSKTAADAVMKLQIAIFQQLEKWTYAREFAQSLATGSPEVPFWWIHWAAFLRQEKSVDEAPMVLGHAAVYHPAHATMLYNLACYAWVAGDVAPARELLKRVFALEDSLNAIAPEDPDLCAMFGEPYEID